MKQVTIPLEMTELGAKALLADLLWAQSLDVDLDFTALIDVINKEIRNK